MEEMNNIGRSLFSLLGAVVAVLEPALPYIVICTLAVLYDCYTAWSLSRRVKRAHPERIRDGKFKSHNAGKVIVTLIKVYALIVLAFLMQMHIIGDALPIDLTKVAAGAVCFWQLWSILENESSCNGAKWAKVAQKILVDKTERHFDIDLSEMEEKEDETLHD